MLYYRVCVTINYKFGGEVEQKVTVDRTRIAATQLLGGTIKLDRSSREELLGVVEAPVTLGKTGVCAQFD
jgi:hypothetical protein